MKYLNVILMWLTFLGSVPIFANQTPEIFWQNKTNYTDLTPKTWLGYHQNKTVFVVPEQNVLKVLKNQQAKIIKLNEAHQVAGSGLFFNHKDKSFILPVNSNTPSMSVGSVINWNEKTAELTPLPSFDEPTQIISGAIWKDHLWILTIEGLFRIKVTADISTNSWEFVTTLHKDMSNQIHLTTQNDGTSSRLFVFASQTVNNSENSYLPIWQFSESNQNWQPLKQNSIPQKLEATKINQVIGFGQSHVLAVTKNLEIFAYNAITKTWTLYPSNLEQKELSSIQNIVLHANQLWALESKGDTNYLFQGEIVPPQKEFGMVNMTVLIVYLLFMVAVGVYFVFKNKSTDDYFRGGQSIPWWAAACSIYATMLSSLTYVALPAVVYQTNWVLLLGIWTIILVAPLAIYVAMPFFRQIDATSAYEYLSKRFNMPVRLFASGLFTLFHVGRMGIVMALTALALSAVTPLSAAESVLLMGVLCLLYCTLGGIEAVIWTDTIQTIVLLIGAVVCFVVIIFNLEGGLSDFIAIGSSDNKFTMVNLNFGKDSITELALWVIILGGIGQNLSSYTADQAVVQRYTVTKESKEAAKSIWTNAAIAGPASLLFFCLGTGLYVFYQTYPEKLDPTIQIDQIFPTFIATELPIGVAGLIVAGIFAAAQSTVSTSMNSIATTVITDFVRPFNLIKTEKGYMSAARWVTFLMGALGTLAGLIFIDPEIRSLMAAYFKVIGMFMGALGGLFVLGALSTKANSQGALIGIIGGVLVMISAWQMGWANGYLYASIGIFSCLIIGYLASLAFKQQNKDLSGLTLYTMKKSLV